MCSVDDVEGYDFSHIEYPTARKPHKCHECGRTIRAGEMYRRFIGKSDGSIDTWKTCAHCVAAGQWLHIVCGGYLVTHMGEELREHWEDNSQYRTVWLGRAIHGVELGWVRKDGSLLAILGPPPIDEYGHAMAAA